VRPNLSSSALKACLHPASPDRLAEGANALAARERELGSTRERLDAELEAARRAAEDTAAECAALQQRAAQLEIEREEFRGWMREAREEAARGIKVRAGHCAWQRV
jgi:outer membrane murein-binding lipoprotein Lpp